MDIYNKNIMKEIKFQKQFKKGIFYFKNLKGFDNNLRNYQVTEPDKEILLKYPIK
jgi:hypothetical protein